MKIYKIELKESKIIKAFELEQPVINGLPYHIYYNLSLIGSISIGEILYVDIINKSTKVTRINKYLTAFLRNEKIKNLLNE